MSGDKTDGPGALRRRPRGIQPPRLPPGPLAELKTLLHRLHVEAGAPSLDEITAHIRADDDLPGFPSRDGVYRILRDPVLPPSQADTLALATVLARLARWDTADAAARTRDLWVAARLHIPPGVPLSNAEDPFDLEVHRPVALEGIHGLPDLTPYVPRAHDHRLIDLVTKAAMGASAIAVLVAESSAGKTRACWEALAPLREAGDWRLWHPDPTRPDVVLHDLGHVAPRTVVWLNETQNYLDTQDGQRIAAALRTLLADRDRAPVLVLGTLWPHYHDTLTREHNSQVRRLLDGTVIPVPDAFTGAELTSMIQAAHTDPRLAWAVEHAPDGRITQEVAGGPELLTRFHTAPHAAKALIAAAMDARRLGHRLALPLSLLEQAAAAYLTDLQLGELGDDWLDQALVYATRPAKGAPGPLTRITARRTRRTDRTTPAGGRPEYRLADYLDQWGRTHRDHHVPGLDFWAAVADHGRPNDQTSLGRAAWARGLYRDAAQLHKNATTHGDLTAACWLVENLRALHPGDGRPARWVAAQDLRVGSRLVSTLMTVLPRESVDMDALAQRVIAHVDLDDADDGINALEALHRMGATERADALARQVVDHTAVDLPQVLVLLWRLRRWGATKQAEILARRAAAQVPLYHAKVVADLLIALHEAGDVAKVAVLAQRIAAGDAPAHPASACDLLDALHRVGADEHIPAVARSTAVHVTVDDRLWVSDLLRLLHRLGAEAEVNTLAGRIVANAARADLFHTSVVLSALHYVGQTEHFVVSAQRALTEIISDDLNNAGWLLAVLRQADEIGLVAACAAVGNPDVVSWFLRELRQIAEPEQVVALAARAAEHTALDQADGVARLLDSLRDLGFKDQGAVLARRAAVDAALASHHAVVRLLEALQKSDVDQATVFAKRVAAHFSLEAAIPVAILLEKVHGLGYVEATTTLAGRAAAHIPLCSYGVDDLARVLRYVGAAEQSAVLARRLTVLTRQFTAPAHVEDGHTVSNLLGALWAVDARDEFARLAERMAASVPLDDVHIVDSLLKELRDTSATQPFAVLARRVATDISLDNWYVVAGLLRTLQEAGAGEQFAMLAGRAAAHCAVDEPAAVMKLLNTLGNAGATEQFAVLAGRVAAEGPVDDPNAVTTLLKTLREASATGSVTVLAGRAAAEVDLRDASKVALLLEALREWGDTEHQAALAWRAATRTRLFNLAGISDLLSALRAAGCDAQAAALTDRLPSEGFFDHYLTLGENRIRFRFGREPDGTEAPCWSWADLE
jgi:hypothetical protein